MCHPPPAFVVGTHARWDDHVPRFVGLGLTTSIYNRASDHQIASSWYAGALVILWIWTFPTSPLSNVLSCVGLQYHLPEVHMRS